ncbi:alpha/beta hydrolase [Neobacillus notoginsengisoli]|uniref:Alpha/beta hydrolase n=1 Tax=Neobacillus notoginsengisoli TaxID=1578198 RepID=A0A417YZR1_9BACI|nr:alpha/beta hydrolase [Neobacillus notoginsengisoli]RHW43383.1 alpha/beta hydrolase [Neobacillus notoginsengisoli]
MEKEVKFGEKDPIYGRLALPAGEGGHPAILLIAGSGPLDRDGNTPKGKIETNLYKEMAGFFTSIGFVTLRYDKRGTGKRDGDWLAAGMWDLVEDARSAVEYLQSHPSVDRERVIVAAHSEGTIIATALGASTKLGGVIFLSGGVDNLSEALGKQRKLGSKELLEKPVLGKLLKLLNVEEKSEKSAAKMMEKFKQSKEDIVKIQLFFKQNAKWYREHDAFNTREALKSMNCPVLALIGDKDVLADKEVLSELPSLVQGKAEIAIINDMEHGLRIQLEELSLLKSGKRFKEILKRPLHPEALATLEAWLSENFLGQTTKEKSQIEPIIS